jgi:hypothetical protein
MPTSFLWIVYQEGRRAEEGDVFDDELFRVLYDGEFEIELELGMGDREVTVPQDVVVYYGVVLENGLEKFPQLLGAGVEYVHPPEPAVVYPSRFGNSGFLGQEKVVAYRVGLDLQARLPGRPTKPLLQPPVRVVL